MLKGRDLLQRTIIHSSTGKSLGRITDLYLEPKQGIIKGIAVETVQDHSIKKLSWEKLHVDDEEFQLHDETIEDEVMIQNEELLEEQSQVLRIADLAGHKVTTENGKTLGEVGDIIFDPEQGSIIALEVSDGLFQDLLTGRLQLPWSDVVQCSAQTVTVSNNWQDAW
ncbi:PRC-barrel domain-containing protein [Heliorestis convoluta]|uniref:PRC-barrel domain containing protein, putative n=1 Tax=Heliorestis convoluta TaxID=356322 RepID=A0A5Q2N2C9_9FIRM|nr:PRC-barrel domain-containing protein [Heliorestis convoluta]QGG46715.1 PRC-barrel domain containing protein, putative [Heliorestis convoluta]